jgi:hypothetical protein
LAMYQRRGTHARGYPRTSWNPLEVKFAE